MPSKTKSESLLEGLHNVMATANSQEQANQAAEKVLNRFIMDYEDVNEALQDMATALAIEATTAIYLRRRLFDAGIDN